MPARERAELLAGLRPVDAVFVVHGPDDLWDADTYAELMAPLRPVALALTAGDRVEAGKREAARLLGVRVVVAPCVHDHSTSRLIELTRELDCASNKRLVDVQR